MRMLDNSTRMISESAQARKTVMVSATQMSEGTGCSVQRKHKSTIEYL